MPSGAIRPSSSRPSHSTFTALRALYRRLSTSLRTRVPSLETRSSVTVSVRLSPMTIVAVLVSHPHTGDRTGSTAIRPTGLSSSFWRCVGTNASAVTASSARTIAVGA